jgi:hypothetical protein
MRQTLKDYGVHCDKVPLLCDNESAIKIAHNPVQHNRGSTLRSDITSSRTTSIKVILTYLM